MTSIAAEVKAATVEEQETLASDGMKASSSNDGSSIDSDSSKCRKRTRICISCMIGFVIFVLGIVVGGLVITYETTTLSKDYQEEDSSPEDYVDEGPPLTKIPPTITFSPSLRQVEDSTMSPTITMAPVSSSSSAHSVPTKRPTMKIGVDGKAPDHINWRLSDYKPLTIHYGDVVVFNWNGNNDVALAMNERHWRHCVLTEAEHLVKKSSLGTYELHSMSFVPGKYFVYGTLPGHCADGQKVEINILD